MDWEAIKVFLKGLVITTPFAIGMYFYGFYSLIAFAAFIIFLFVTFIVGLIVDDLFR